jgi:predicted dehydrogenase
VTDLDPDRLKAVAEEFQIPGRYSSAADMLAREKLDIVSVCVPNKLHKELTIQALKAGCHVLCEKPMAINAAEAGEMLAAARKAGRRLMINFSYRFTPQGRALKAQVDSGILGQVYFGRTVWHRRRGIPGFGGWFTNKELSGGGALIDLGVHRLDLALWLMGYPAPDWVIGSTYDHIGSRLAREAGRRFSVEDLAAGFITFKNGASLVVEASWAANIRENELMETRLLGTEAGLVHRNVNESYEFEGEISLERAGCQLDMKIHPPVPDSLSSMHHFTDCILNGRPHMAPGEEGAVVMRILDSLYESARAGAPVRL